MCRMKTVSKSALVIRHNLPAAGLRIIALSATLPNLGCIGDFVEAKSDNVIAFPPSFRPVPLTVHVHGYPMQKSDWWFEKSLERKVSEVVTKFSSGRPALVFCNSRQSAESAAEELVKASSTQNRDPEVKAISQRVSCPKLRESLLRGVGYHHANLPQPDRLAVERLFRERKLQALCCTSTLAMGVNLPAHLVVIKSTAQWQGKGTGYGQLATSSILQMIGRAGRPGLDDHGIAVCFRRIHRVIAS